MENVSASIIIATADRPAELRRCLNSLHGGLPADCEVIVVDASRDGQSEAVTRAFARVRHLRQAARNLCAQRNRGLRESTAAVTVFVDDDIVAQPGWLRALLTPYADPAVASVVGAVHQANLPSQPPNQGPEMTHLGPRQTTVNWQTRLSQDVPNGHSANMSFRRDALIQLGGWDEHLAAGCHHGEELEVFVRLRRAGGRIVYQPQAVVEHCPGPTRGYTRSSSDRHYMFWVGYNEAYANTKLFLGRKEFFWYFGFDSLRYVLLQTGRLLAVTANNLGVTAYTLFGRLTGLCLGLRQRLRHS